MFEAILDRVREPVRGGPRVRLDEGFCTEVADVYERAPMLAPDPELLHGYSVFARENLRQFESIVDSGLRVEPWRGKGQPYRDSADLRRHVRDTGTLRLFLTRCGHGPGPPTGYHPLLEPAGVTIEGVELTHNDVFRVVHDVFGHVVAANGFGPRGEFTATYLHLRTYPEAAHPVLFTEQIGQICWFYYGPHLRDERGAVRAPGDPGYLPAARRPYARQKVFAFDRRFLDEFRGLFDNSAKQRSDV